MPDHLYASLHPRPRSAAESSRAQVRGAAASCCAFCFLLIAFCFIHPIIRFYSDLSLTKSSVAPRVFQNLADSNPLLDISIKHEPYEINALFTHHPWNPQVVVHDLVYAIERIFFVDDGVEQDAQGPDILLFAAVSTAGEDLWGGVICRVLKG
jgi:hypothetical protein